MGYYKINKMLNRALSGTPMVVCEEEKPYYCKLSLLVPKNILWVCGLLHICFTPEVGKFATQIGLRHNIFMISVP